jgi:putative polyhydroxyalkanoate system protein
MPDIKMIKFHSLPVSKARALVEKAADDLGREYDLASEWHGDTLRFHRSGVDGAMQVTADEIRLEVTLGWLLRPFKARFVEAIEHNFDGLLAQAAGAREAGKSVGKRASAPAAKKQAPAKKQAAAKRQSVKSAADAAGKTAKPARKAR